MAGMGVRKEIKWLFILTLMGINTFLSEILGRRNSCDPSGIRETNQYTDCSLSEHKAKGRLLFLAENSCQEFQCLIW